MTTRIEIPFFSPEALRVCWEDDLGKGRLLCPTSGDLAVGSEVELTLTLPDAPGPYVLGALVEEVDGDRYQMVLDVHVADLDAQAFEAYVSGNWRDASILGSSANGRDEQLCVGGGTSDSTLQYTREQYSTLVPLSISDGTSDSTLQVSGPPRSELVRLSDLDSTGATTRPDQSSRFPRSEHGVGLGSNLPNTSTTLSPELLESDGLEESTVPEPIGPISMDIAAPFGTVSTLQPESGGLDLLAEICSSSPSLLRRGDQLNYGSGAFDVYTSHELYAVGYLIDEQPSDPADVKEVVATASKPKERGPRPRWALLMALSGVVAVATATSLGGTVLVFQQTESVDEHQSTEPAEDTGPNVPTLGEPILGEPILISTEPPGAQVRVGGVLVGETPTRFMPLPDGWPTTVRVELDGHVPEDRRVSTELGSNLHLLLEPNPIAKPAKKTTSHWRSSKARRAASARSRRQRARAGSAGLGASHRLGRGQR